MNEEGGIGCHVHRCNLCLDEHACAFAWCAGLRILACAACRRRAWDRKALDRALAEAVGKGA